MPQQQQIASQLLTTLAGLPHVGALSYNADFSEIQVARAPWPVLAREVGEGIGPTLAAAPAQLRAALVIINGLVTRLRSAMAAASHTDATQYAMGGDDQLWNACRDLGLSIEDTSNLTALITDVAAFRSLGLVALKLYRNAQDEAAWGELYEALLDAGMFDGEAQDQQVAGE